MSAPLPPHLLERLGGLEVIALQIVEALQTGIHPAPLRGPGDEFIRHREYRAGDDLRSLDWRLYGRTDRLYVREYRADSNLRALLLIDATLSMGYADAEGLTKLRYASYLAAALTHLMLRVGDQVGLAVSGGDGGGEGARLLVPPSNRPGHLHELIGALEGVSPAGGGVLAPALEGVADLLGRRGRLVVISDLLEEDDGDALLTTLGRIRSRGDEVIFLRPLTPAELGEEPLGPGRYYDPERPEASIDAYPSVDTGYAARVSAYYTRLERALHELGAEYLATMTTTPIETLLAGWLGERGGRR